MFINWKPFKTRTTEVFNILINDKIQSVIALSIRYFAIYDSIERYNQQGVTQYYV